MSLTYDQFVEELSASGIVEPSDVQDAAAAAGGKDAGGDPRRLAAALVEKGKLTKFQAAAFLQGVHKGLVFGQYVVLERIGAGGMGIVFKARHRRMGRVVAVKFLPKEAIDSERSVQRFYREVQAAAKLNHPNIVTAYDAGEFHGSHYLVMEFVDGCDLSAMLRQRGPLPVARAVDYILQAARGLGYAHAHGIIHRDIKPGNMLVSKEHVLKLMDMGLARVYEQAEQEIPAETTITAAGRLVGTVNYMSPEHAANARKADHRSDIYSLGCTLYRLLTNKPPYIGETAIETVLAHRTQPIPSLRAARADVSEALEAVFIQMMAKDPQQRFQSATELVAELERAAALGAAAGASLGGDESASHSSWISTDFDDSSESEGIPVARIRAGASPGEASEPSAGGLSPIESLAMTVDRFAGPPDSPPPQGPASRPLPQAAPRPAPPQRVQDRRAGNRRYRTAAIAVFAPLLLIALAVVVLLVAGGGHAVLELDWPSDERGGAWVEIDGQRRNIPAHGPVTFALGPGEHRIVIQRYGFETIEWSLTFESDQRQVRAVEWRQTALADARPDPTPQPSPPQPNPPQGRDDPPQPQPQPPDPSPPPAGPVVPAGQQIDLLSLAIVPDDVLSGTWRREGEALHVENSGRGAIALPTALNGSFDLSVDFTLLEGRGNIGFHLPAGELSGMFILGSGPPPSSAGIELIDEKPASDNESTVRPGTVTIGAINQLRVQVRMDGTEMEVSAELNGRSFVHWKGDASRLSVYQGWKLKRTDIPGLAVYESAVVFHRVDLAVRSGEAKLLRAPPAGWRPKPIPAASRRQVIVSAEPRDTLNVHPAAVTGLAISGDGKTMISASEQGFVTVSDAPAMKQRHTFEKVTPWIRCVAVSADGARFACGSLDHSIKLFETATGVEKAYLKGHSSGVVAMTFTKDGKGLISASWDKTIIIWDLSGPEPVIRRTLRGHEADVNCIALSTDETVLVSGSSDQTVRAWDMTSGDASRTLPGHTSPVWSVALSPDGNIIAAGGADGKIITWNAQTGEPLPAPTGHRGGVRALAFSPDGSTLVSAGDDQIVRLCRVRDGREIAALEGHTAVVRAVAFSKDGKALVSAGTDRSVRLWNCIYADDVE